MYKRAPLGERTRERKIEKNNRRKSKYTECSRKETKEIDKKE